MTRIILTVLAALALAVPAAAAAPARKASVADDRGVAAKTPQLSTLLRS